jgi:hypothetical protein
MGLSILTGGLAFVGAANATDLIVNGSFEEDPSIGWTGYFKTYNYSAAYFTGPPIPEAEEPGSLYSWRHGLAEGNYTGPATQTVDLTLGASASEIDSGLGQFSFSTWLASYGQPGSNPDAPYLTLQFFDASSAQVGSTVIIDRVSASGFNVFADGVKIFDDNVHLHSWAKYIRNGTIPPGSRTATVGITHSPNSGLSGTPDSYTDLVKLDVTVGTQVAPPSVGDVVGSPTGFSLEIVESSVPLDPDTLTIQLDGSPLTPTSITKEGLITKVVFSQPAGTFFPSGSSHTVNLSVRDTKGNTATEVRTFSVITYASLPATARVTPDTSKRGFIWRVHQNAALQSNDNERPELQLAGKLIDSATEAPYENLAVADAQGVAIEPAAPADPTWAPLRFEIETVINMNQGAGGNFGAFTPDDIMPGIPSALDGIAGEITTYLELPSGLITMGVNSDDGFRTKSGQPLDAFQAVLLGEFNGGRGAGDTLFTFLVPEAGVYPFRTVWEEGGGDANIEWFTIKADGSKVLVNDTDNGGVPAFRATTSGLKPFVRTVTPSPAPRQLDGVSSVLSVELQDGDNEEIDDNSIALKLDGKNLAVSKERTGKQVRFTFEPEGLQIPSETHTAELSFSGKAGSTRNEQWTFRNLKKLILPTPKILETFNDFAEDTQPEGWTAWNFTAHNADGRDITNQKSESYENWVLVNVANIPSIDGTSPFNITPGQTITINGNQVEIRNGNPPEGEWPEWLMSGNVLYAESDSRSNDDSLGGPNKGQTQFITTKPYDLSTFKDVVITFSSIYLQNQDSLGAVEYSVDGGTSWLPVMYFLEEPDIKVKADGTVDALRTFLDPNTDTSTWVDNEVPKGGKYGDGIAAPITEALSGYIVPRINDGDVEGKRIEIARLTQAAGKSDVRLRLASLGTDSWYFAIDNLAFYDIPGSVTAPPSLSIAKSGAAVVITFEGSLLESSSVNGPWAPLAGNSPLTLNSPAGTKFYRAIR